MLNAIKTFAGDESGAVTVDWVVLTAALVGLGLAVMGVVSSGINTVTNNIADGLEAVPTTGRTDVTRTGG